MTDYCVELNVKLYTLMSHNVMLNTLQHVVHVCCVSAEILSKQRQPSPSPDAETATAATAEASTYLTPIIQRQDEYVEADNHVAQPGTVYQLHARTVAG